MSAAFFCIFIWGLEDFKAPLGTLGNLRRHADLNVPVSLVVCSFNLS